MLHCTVNSRPSLRVSSVAHNPNLLDKFTHPRNPHPFNTFHTPIFRISTTHSSQTICALFRKTPGGIPIVPISEPRHHRFDRHCGIFSALFHFPEAFPK